MTVEAPLFTISNQVVEDNYLHRFPEFKLIPDNTEIRYLDQREEFTDLLIERGLTPQERRVVRTALRAFIYHRHPPDKLVTVGEIREMTVDELIAQGKQTQGYKIGEKRLAVLRALFGKISDETETSAPTEAISFRVLKENELTQIKALIIKDWERALRLPRIEVSEEVKPWNIKGLSSELSSRGFTQGEITGVSNILGSVYQFTVGELKSMSDEELIEVERIGPKGLVIIRMLFGYTQSELDIPDFLKQRIHRQI